MTDIPFDLHLEVARAARRIRRHVVRTPVEASPALAGRGTELFLKLESLQETGSFKLRGAMNRILAAKDPERRRGVVTASSGNHGLAVGRALAALGLAGTVYLPKEASPAKVRAIRATGIRVVRHGEDCLEAELRARAAAQDEGRLYVSPYNDLLVAAGQGTVGVELLEQVPEVDAVIAAVGGGGLIGGIAAWIKARRPEVEVIGASPRRSPAMARSVTAGRILDLPGGPTLSDGTAGGLEPGAVTFPLCRSLVDRFVLVGEAAIARAMRLVLDHHHHVIEGAAGVAVAAFLAERARLAGRRVAVIVCGRNIATPTLRAVLGDGKRA